MILYASQRGRSAELALHLLNGDQFDHVTVHEIRGFVADDLPSALREAYAISRGTRCRQFLFSVSLNPPEYADVPVEDFEAAIEEIERKVGLVGQPRIVVFHEKNGRRHCHCVWSRIDAAKLTAVRMSHFKRKLMEVSHVLYLKHGWKLPKGMEKGQPRSPLQLTRQEYRQAVRLAEDGEALKSMFKSAWERSDSKETFVRALQEQGMLLAKGDRRGYVALDIKGGIYSLTRWVDIGTRDLKARLGPADSLPSIEKAKEYLASRMTENLNRFIGDAKKMASTKRTPLVQELRLLVAHQRADRQELLATQQLRWQLESRQRSARFMTGAAGLWQRVTGEYQKLRIQNANETRMALTRDRKEQHQLIRSHLQERQELQKTVLFYREEHRREVFRLRQDIARYVSTGTQPILPQPAASGGIAVKLPLAAQLAEVERKISLLTADIGTLQASLESNLLSDDMRARIRRVIEKTLEAFQIKSREEKEQETKEQQNRKDIQAKHAEFNDYVRRYAELQSKLEAETRKLEANRAFLELVGNMGYALNGIPRWTLNIMSPPQDKKLDESLYLQTIVRERSNVQLMERVFRSPENASQVAKRPAIDPATAVPNLRRNVLEVSEMLHRAGVRPPTGSGGGRSVAPVTIKMTTAPVIRVNSKFGLPRR